MSCLLKPTGQLSGCRNRLLTAGNFLPYFSITAWFSLASCFLPATSTVAQSVTSISPRTCRPGQSTELTIRGKDLTGSLRVATVNRSIDWELKKVEPQQATISLTLPDTIAPGPFPIWIGTGDGTINQQILLVDDLDEVVDNAANHSVETAQVISNRCSVAGFCDGSVSDFYRLHAVAGERIAVEVVTQGLRSSMDPLLRLTDREGKLLAELDDTAIGPDGRFAYRFQTEGDYWIEVRDSAYAATSMPYQLRVGDFPVLQQCFPLAIKQGETQPIEFVGTDSSSVDPLELTPAQTGATRIAARFGSGQAATWLPVRVSEYPSFLESTTGEAFPVPSLINGRLQKPNEVDRFNLRGTKDQTIRVRAVTRSLGSPTLLEMRLLDSAGNPIAATQVSEVDEWSFDAKLPTDGDYQLEVSDLLRRGGPEFNYAIEVIPAGTFEVGLKPHANTRESFAIETGHGGCAIDLQIDRFGYDGEIEIAFASAAAGLRLMNSRIPAKATSARLFVAADDSWSPNRLEILRLKATAVDTPGTNVPVRTVGLRRLKEPHVLPHAIVADGSVALTATAPTELPFSIDPVTIPFASPVRSQVATLTLNRLQKTFKGNVQLLPDRLPSDWQVSTKIEKDTYQITLDRGADRSTDVNEVRLVAFGEWNGRGYVQTIVLPLKWIEPLRAQWKVTEPLIQGGRADAEIFLTRKGTDPQPVTITLAGLPDGVTVAEPITVAADQTSGKFVLRIAEDAVLDTATEVRIEASSTYAGQAFVNTTLQPLPGVIEAPTSLQVVPARVDLSDPRSRQQIIVTGFDAKESPSDWTRIARITSADPSIAVIEEGVVLPVSQGETEVVIEAGPLHQSIPVHVGDITQPRPIDFESEVLVALSKQGCNSGACHGSPSGKGGFRLSLRAFDRELDQLTLIREAYGRRVNPIDPEQSLVLLKPTMNVAHGGGKQLRKDDAAYAILHGWIAEGARAEFENVPRITRLSITPGERLVLPLETGEQQLAVTAHFSDGRTRDVTHLAAYETSDSTIATVDAGGLVTPHDRGEAAILVRVLEHIEAVPLTFVEDIDGFEWKSPQPRNYVDQLVYDKLRQLQFLPSEPCNDDEFLRRIHLDLLGTLPSVSETTAFLADPAPDKRERLIDSLLEREEYAKFWALKWGDLLKMTRKSIGDAGVYKYHRWVEQSLHENMPYDQFARELLTASGSTLNNPPANFYRTSTDMNECVETISQVFLGARLQCAKCHNHPFERWTQDNYYGLGAFFNRVQRRQTERPGEMFIYSQHSGEVTQPRTGQVMQPWLPQTGHLKRDPQTGRRVAFADWLIDPDNPYFARIEANRIWSHLFARGIVDPIDDFRDSNPPTNAPLLDALAKDFVEHGYDRKHLLRVILRSQTYQASFRTNRFNRDDDKYFSHQQPRLLTAEQLLDAINQTLQLNQRFGNLPTGTQATQLPAPDVTDVEFLKVFGQPERSTVCACERVDDSNLGMAIELFNGKTIHQKLKDENNRFRKAIASGKSLEALLREIYLAALCRQPSAAELKTALTHCQNASDPAAGVEDVCWALFNTDEFLFQH